MTECEEVSEGFPRAKNYAEAYSIIEEHFPEWRDYWSIQQRDNVAESMITRNK